MNPGCVTSDPPCPFDSSALWWARRLLCQRSCPAGTRRWGGVPTLASRPPWLTCGRHSGSSGNEKVNKEKMWACKTTVTYNFMQRTEHSLHWTSLQLWKSLHITEQTVTVFHIIFSELIHCITFHSSPSKEQATWLRFFSNCLLFVYPKNSRFLFVNINFFPLLFPR